MEVPDGVDPALLKKVGVRLPHLGAKESILPPMVGRIAAASVTVIS